MQIRPANSFDLDSYYAIALATGLAGKDAGHLYDDPLLIGHIYSAPYLCIQPDYCFTAVDDFGVVGFVVGAPNTPEFETQLEEKWWPGLRLRYEDPLGIAPKNRSVDQMRAAMIHHPEIRAKHIVQRYPAHIHMNILPRGQGRGIGTKLLETWVENARKKGVKSVHLGASKQNMSGIKFWRKNGFAPIDGLMNQAKSRSVWLGQDI
ncbi:MAG: GNAT family N-acetyltransferase [Rhodobacteraceae bacterium]|nr:GNAT family N-acetyltransferase [Paracoccaceae bacterium]